MAHKKFEASSTQSGELIILELTGLVDASTIEEFKEKMESICSRPGTKVILDCSALTYLNSRAIGMVVGYHRRLATENGKLALCGLNAKLVKTLALLQLDKTLMVFETQEKARSGI